MTVLFAPANKVVFYFPDFNYNLSKPKYLRIWINIPSIAYYRLKWFILSLWICSVTTGGELPYVVCRRETYAEIIPKSKNCLDLTPTKRYFISVWSFLAQRNDQQQSRRPANGLAGKSFNFKGGG